MSLSVSLTHRFDGFTLDARFEAPAGLTVLYGRSGSGKTTIINAVAGLFRPDTARIVIGDSVLDDTDQAVSVPTHARRIGYIFQDARLFPHLSVRQNLAYGGWVSRHKAPLAQTDHVVEMLGLGPLLDRRPHALSGGEKQRVAIGRALLSDPRVILADEPLASLDEARKAEILPYFERLRDEGSVPILYVSHAPAEVARLATTVIALEAGQVVRQGPALDVLADPMVTPAGVGAAGAALEAVITAHHADGLTELSAGGVPLFLPRVAQEVGTLVRVRLPASDVLLSRERPDGLSALNIIPGTVSALHEGSNCAVVVSLDTPAGPLLSRITQRSARAMGLTIGAPCHAIVKTVAIASRG